MTIFWRMPGWAAAALALASGGALAGDIASFQPIGFSPDGGVFAFEEFGVQDGSGFPYSNIFFIDTKNDAFLPDTPFRVRLDDEAAGLGKARAETYRKAASLIERHDMTGNPGLLAAFDPITEDGETHRLRYRQHAAEPPVGGFFQLSLAEFALPVPDRCKDFVPEGTGFRLAFEEEDGKPSSRTVHVDEKIPESRNCPTGYRLGGVMIHHPQGGSPVHVALVQVMSFGFEGRDGRWIAIPAMP